ARQELSRARVELAGLRCADNRQVAPTVFSPASRWSMLDRKTRGSPSRSNLHRDMGSIWGEGGRQRARSASPCMPPIRVVYTEPNGSVLASPPGCLVRRALGCHPTRRSGAAWTFRRFDYGPCREVPHDPHGHEEARRCLGAGGARHHGEGRARADLHARRAPIGGRDGLARDVPPALGLTLHRAGQGCRRTKKEGENRWTKEERVSPAP